VAANILRYIKQRYLSKCLNARRNNPPETTVAAKKAWRRSNKKDIRKACYKQQYGLCAYTELSLDDDELGCHLEHIAPRTTHPALTFIPHNIVLSTLDDIQSGALARHEQFGGHHKSENYSESWFISPFNKRCSEFFSYSLTGKVEASTALETQEQVKALKTIETLNLNATYLVHRRRMSLQKLIDDIESLGIKSRPLRLEMPDSKEIISPDNAEIAQLVNAALEPIDRKLPEFYSAKKQLFERYGFNLPQPL